MDSIDYAQALVKEFAVDQSEALKALDSEVDDQRNDTFRVRGRKPTYKQALDAAYEGIRSWLRDSDEYVIKLDWEDIRQFAFSHRKACVWAVLTCKARKAVQS